MLTIKNIADIKLKEFHFADTWWMLYGVDVNNIEYRFIFIPMQAGRYDTQKAQLVLLDRNKKRIGNEVLGYRLWTTDGKHTYLNTNDIRNWNELVKLVYQNRMVC
jgi:hypothetical protein